VRLEPSGWGTKVTLAALPVMVDQPTPEPQPELEPEPVAPPPERGFWARLFRRPPVLAPLPPEQRVVVADMGPLPAIDAATGEAVLGRALDQLGSAHHRPFSR
jgi:hypothetical protein